MIETPVQVQDPSLIVGRDLLTEALAGCSSAIRARSPNPTLRGVRLTAKDGVFVLDSTNLEMSVRFEITAVQVVTEGVVLVECDRFQRIVSSMTDDHLEISVANGQIKIAGGSASMTIATIKGELPPWQDDADIEAVEVSPKLLLAAIGQVISIPPEANERFTLQGVLFKTTDDKKSLQLVATDLRRMGLATIKSSGGAVNMIVPTESLRMAQKIIGGSQDVSIHQVSGGAIFQTNNATIRTGVLEGTFPPFMDIIPKHDATSASISIEDILPMAKRASLLFFDDGNKETVPTFIVTEWNDKGISASVDSRLGKSSEKIFAKIQGPPVKIGLNIKNFVAAISSVHTEYATVGLEASNKPMTIRCESQDHQYIHLIMPVNIE